MKKPITNSRGFSFIELIISIAIISILLIASAGVLSTTLVVVKNEGTDTQYLYQAQEAMEKLTSGQIANLEDYPKLSLIVEHDQAVTINGKDGTSYTVSGKYYTIKRQDSSKIILKTFIPENK